ncbi:SH3 domain-containing protein [Aestuariibaculum sediminum]|uniref:Tetratricopeptide repeat protein n=1 Tax=Aestuariibaculum sediminum TaxID=2770637 RepID=A0A8J6U890_9FLAO|nr:tetratricopeptide repeat protein [Aestuariibaculum sediminum]MBD0831107.1 tetratricopeptide repeat protein [Aestuariibaculum sediminum]
MKIYLYTLLFLLSFGVFAQNQALFEQANTLYNDGKYAEAIDKYEAILATKNESAELYFNLGNANYKLNNIAPSIYYYEKALQLAPNDTEIQNNLEFAKNMTIDAIEVLPEGAVSRLVKRITNTMSYDGWAKLAIAFVFCFVILFLVYYFAYSTVRKRLAFIGSFVALGLVCLSLSLAFHKYTLVKKDKPAIVFVQESKVKNEPNNRSEEAFRLHEGTKVQILDTVEDWKKIKLADGKSGWVLKQDIRAL